jgi:hypothetical protein
MLSAMFAFARPAPAYAQDFAPMTGPPQIPLASPTNDPLTPV